MTGGPRPVGKQWRITPASGLGFVVRLRWEGADAPVPPPEGVTWVDFEVFNVSGQSGDTPPRGLFRVDGPEMFTDELDAATPMCQGFVKWDGCTQMWFDEPLHVDSGTGLAEVFAAIMGARKVAADVVNAEE